MTRTLTGTALAVLLTASLGAQTTGQQQPPPPSPPQVTAPAQKPTEVTLVGCVAQGTSASVYLFENAVDPAKKDEKAKAFRLVSSGEEMDFTPHLNHKVQIVGTLAPMAASAGAATTTPPQAGAKVNEKDLPVLTVKSVSHIATTCSTPAQ